MLDRRRKNYRGFSITYVNCDGVVLIPHFHDEYGLSVNTHGYEIVKTGGISQEVKDGGITLYNPAQVQSAHSLTDRWRYFNIYIEPSFMIDVFGFQIVLPSKLL